MIKVLVVSSVLVLIVLTHPSGLRIRYTRMSVFEVLKSEEVFGKTIWENSSFVGS